MINIKEDAQLSVMNHSCAHMMAQAIRRQFPQALFWVGPVITEGFYYDIDLGETVLSETDFAKIEQEMKKISKEAKYIIREEISRQAALERFKSDPYKIDLIQNMADDEVISTYKQGEFEDLCRGPHVASTKELKFFKLLKVSGAYFKGDSKNKMLQRVYGICFATQEALDAHLNQLEEAKKRDHKKLGRELELFMMSEYGPGFPFWLHKGMILRNILENFWYEEHTKEDYEFIKTPIMLSQDLWEISGHWFNYKENMYISEVDDRQFAIKPMNCPGGMLVYKNSLHSYKDLPLRVGELGLVHRHEASGALNGLFRVRTFTQDDAHLYMRPDQIEDEIIRLINFFDRIYKLFNLPYKIELSTRPEEKYIGTVEVWDESEKALASACEKAGKAVKINPGDGAFYGPKLDFHLQDSIGRSWQCGTIQLDMNLPERFDLTYIDSDGEKKRPVMLHRVIFGSVERFIGILIEHYAGAFPMWLAPEQIRILPVNHELHTQKAEELKAKLTELGLRVEVDARNEKLGYRLREAQVMKVPVQLVLGDDEIAHDSVNVRRYGSKDSKTLSIAAFVEEVVREVSEKSQ